MASATQYKIREELGITAQRRAHPVLPAQPLAQETRW
jgi:hypothetical protein